MEAVSLTSRPEAVSEIGDVAPNAPKPGDRVGLAL